MSTPAFSNVLCLGAMCGVEKVSQLHNRPVMSHFDTRMSGTSTEKVAHRIQQKLPATTSREGLWDLVAHGHGKESLSETIRPFFISKVSPDLSQSTHRLKEKKRIHFREHY
jgi:hypothetical protein